MDARDVFVMVLFIVVVSGMLVWATWPKLKEEREYNRRAVEDEREMRRPHIERIMRDEHVPKWVAKVREEQRRTFGSGNGRVD